MSAYAIAVECCSSLRDALERLERRVQQYVTDGYEPADHLHVVQAGSLWVAYKELEHYEGREYMDWINREGEGADDGTVRCDDHATDA